VVNDFGTGLILPFEIIYLRLKEEVADKAFFAELGHALHLGGDVRGEGAARVGRSRARSSRSPPCS
jgi:hypothetical protein